MSPDFQCPQAILRFSKGSEAASEGKPLDLEVSTSLPESWVSLDLFLHVREVAWFRDYGRQVNDSTQKVFLPMAHGLLREKVFIPHKMIHHARCLLDMDKQLQHMAFADMFCSWFCETTDAVYATNNAVAVWPMELTGLIPIRMPLEILLRRGDTGQEETVPLLGISKTIDVPIMDAIDLGADGVTVDESKVEELVVQQGLPKLGYELTRWLVVETIRAGTRLSYAISTAGTTGAFQGWGTPRVTLHMQAIAKKC
jgi:hypothetical protein